MTVANVLGADLDATKVVGFDIMADETRQDWQSHVRELAGGPSFYSISRGLPFLVLASYADNLEVLRGDQSQRFNPSPSPDAEISRYVPGLALDNYRGLRMIMAMGGDEHKRNRQAMQPAFGAHGIGVRVGFIEHAVERLLDEVEAKGGEFDAISDFGRPLITEVLLKGMLGTQPEHIDAFTTMAYHVHRNDGHTLDHRRAHEQVIAVAESMLEGKRVQGRDNFVGRMIAACDDGQISRDEFVGGIVGVCTGGLGSTSAATGMMLYFICRYPEQFEQVRQDPQLVSPAVEESLRFHPPGLALNLRFSDVETQIGGTTVYPGMPIVPSPPFANYDPTRFDDPWEFDVRRNPKHLSFGNGMHFCIGAMVARKVMHVSLSRVLARLPKLRLVDPDLAPRPEGPVGVLRPGALPMQIA